MHPRRDTKKARRTLVLCALIFFLGEIVAGFMIDRAPLKFRFPDVPPIIRAARMRGRSPEIVFLGGSRFKNLVVATVVEQELADATSNGTPFVLNAAVAGGGPETFDFIGAKLLDAAVRPSIAVIEVSPETISRRNFLLYYHIARQFTWADVLDSVSDAFYSGQGRRLFSTRLIPVYFFRKEFRQWALEASRLQVLLCCPNANTKRSQTQAPADVSMTSAERLVKGTKVTRDRLRRFQIGGTAHRALERLLERNKALGITTILLGTPMSSPARAEYVSNIDVLYHAYMQKMREKYGVHFVNYRDRVPDELFRTAYYTTPQGASYASRLFAREVLAPLWRNRSPQNARFSAKIDFTPQGDAEGDLDSQKGEESVE